MEQFDDIRPYQDSEVRSVLERLLRNDGLLDAVCSFRFPWLSRWLGGLLKPLVSRVLRREVAGVKDVRDFQMVVEKYMSQMIESTTTGYSVSGLDQLDCEKSYLFLSNHRDIAMDPAFVGYVLHQNGFDTVRIAIGDNLLTRDYVSDLMRLNKSFIVKRSAKGPRQMLAAYRQLSAYIRYSLHQDGQSIWIAQREGRAKDGRDVTEPAIIKMLTMSRNKKKEPFAELIEQLAIVPVAISYEWDPCDAAKAAELYARETTGTYEKAEQEDIASIAQGISGAKGHVHVAFGSPLGAGFESPEAVATEVDRQIIGNYRLHPVNILAFQQLEGEGAALGGMDQPSPVQRSEFQQRLNTVAQEHRPWLLAMYANSVRRKLELGLSLDAGA
jgi:hypothetical protein